MSQHSSKHWLLLAIIFVIALFLRTVWLDEVVSILNRDEASIGYNAYSILKTGRDEYGVHLPFSFRSFGDYKLPGMIYLLVPVIKFLDLNITAVRLPTAVFGALTIWAVYWLLAEMGWSKRVRLLTALLLSLSFWHLSQSRLVYEPVMALFWSTLSWASWLRGLNQKPKWLLVALIFYFISSCIYNLPWLLLPLLFIATTFILQKTAIIKNKLSIVTLCFVGLIFLTVGLASRQTTSGKLNVTLFTDAQLASQSQVLTHAGLLSNYPSLAVRLFQHRYLLAGSIFLRNYVAVFNPALIYFDGDRNNWHSLDSIYLGDINPAELIFVLISISYIIKNISSSKVRLVLAYFLLSPVMSALTITDPVLNRLVDYHLALTILAAVGIDELLRFAKLSCGWKVIAGLTWSVWAFYLVLFLFRYFYVFDKVLPEVWQPGIDQVMTQVEDKYHQNDTLIILSDMDLSYAYIAFRQKIDPAEFMATAKRRTIGFDHVAEIRNYRFMMSSDILQLNPSNIMDYISDSYRQFLIVRRTAFPPELKPDFIVTDFRGDPLWYGKSYTAVSLIDYYRTQPLSSDKLRMIQYLQSCANNNCQLDILKNNLIKTQ